MVYGRRPLFKKKWRQTVLSDRNMLRVPRVVIAIEDIDETVSSLLSWETTPYLQID